MKGINNICNKYNVSISNKKKIVNIILNKNNNKLNKFLLTNNLVSFFKTSEKLNSHISFYKNNPKFKSLTLKKKNDHEYNIR